jgi:hypothetical protein
MPGMSPRSAAATAQVAVPIDDAFRVVTTVDPSRFYPRFGILPAVTEVRDASGPWDAPGRTRTLVLSNGGTLVETIREVTAPRVFAYDLSDFTGLFGALVAGGHSEWRFADSDGGTRIAWTYAFTPRRGRGLLVGAIVRFAWAPYMRRVLPPIAAEAVAVAARG